MQCYLALQRGQKRHLTDEIYQLKSKTRKMVRDGQVPDKTAFN